MGKLSFGRVLECFNLPSGAASCLCFNSFETDQDHDLERKPFISPEQAAQMLKLKDASSKPLTLAFQLKPKMVVLRVSIHCSGCARKVEKHISKIEGVTSYEIDLETKMVVIVGDIIPFEILESVSKVKYAELWSDS